MTTETNSENIIKREQIQSTSDRKGLVVRKILDYENNVVGDVVAVVLLTKHEEILELYDDTGELTLQSVTLQYMAEAIQTNSDRHLRGPLTFTFSAKANPLRNEVSLTGGNVMIPHTSIRGHRIGTYIMNDIVSWAKKWPNTSVIPIRISSVDAETHIAKTRRNQFYEQFNLRFDYDCPEKREGRFIPMTAKELRNSDKWKHNIEEVEESKIIASLIEERDTLSDELKRQRTIASNLKSELSEIQSSPVKYAFQISIIPSLKVISIGSIIGLLLVLAYYPK